MDIEVYNFTDLVTFQTVCKSTHLQVYISIDPLCQNMDIHSSSPLNHMMWLSILMDRYNM